MACFSVSFRRTLPSNRKRTNCSALYSKRIRTPLRPEGPYRRLPHRPQCRAPTCCPPERSHPKWLCQKPNRYHHNNLPKKKSRKWSNASALLFVYLVALIWNRPNLLPNRRKNPNPRKNPNRRKSRWHRKYLRRPVRHQRPRNPNHHGKPIHLRHPTSPHQLPPHPKVPYRKGTGLPTTSFTAPKQHLCAA